MPIEKCNRVQSHVCSDAVTFLSRALGKRDGAECTISHIVWTISLNNKHYSQVLFLWALFPYANWNANVRFIYGYHLYQ